MNDYLNHLLEENLENLEAEAAARDARNHQTSNTIKVTQPDIATLIEVAYPYTLSEIRAKYDAMYQVDKPNLSE